MIVYRHLPLSLFILFLCTSGCKGPEPAAVTPFPNTTSLDTLQKAAVNLARSHALRNPNIAEHRGKYAYALSVHGAHTAAAQEFSAAKLLDPRTPLWAYRHARSIIEAGDTKNGIPDLESIVAEFPAYLPARHYLATAYHDHGESDKAWQLILNCLAQTPSSFPLQTSKAEILLDSGLHREALEILKTITNIDKKTPYPYRLLGEVYLLEGNAVPEQVENILKNASPSERTIVLDPKEKEFLQQKTGRDYQIRIIGNNIRGRNFPAAEKIATSLLSAFPQDPSVRALTAQCYHSSGRSVEAQKILEDTPSEFMNDNTKLLWVDILVREAEDLQAQGANSSATRKIRKAMINAKEVVENSSADWKSHFVLGKCHALLGDNASARGSLRTAIELNDEHIPLSFKLFEVSTQLNDRETAKFALDSVLKVDPENLIGNIQRGLLAVSVGDPTLAKQCLERATKVDPEHQGVSVLRTRIRTIDQ